MKRRTLLQNAGIATASLTSLSTLSAAKRTRNYVALRGSVKNPVALEHVQEARSRILTPHIKESTGEHGELKPIAAMATPSLGKEEALVGYNFAISKSGTPMEQFGIATEGSAQEVLDDLDSELPRFKRGERAETSGGAEVSSSSTTSGELSTQSLDEDFANWTTLNDSETIRNGCPTGKIKHDWMFKNRPSDGSADIDYYGIQAQVYAMPGANPNVCSNNEQRLNEVGARHRWDNGWHGYNNYVDGIAPSGSASGEMTSKTMTASINEDGGEVSVGFTYSQPAITTRDISDLPNFAEWKVDVNEDTSMGASNVDINPASISRVDVPSTEGTRKMLDIYGYFGTIYNWGTVTERWDSRESFDVYYGPQP